MGEPHSIAMHSENEWREGVSPLENAFQRKAMLDTGVFENQSAMAAALGCHRGTVSRAVRTATALFDEEWIERLVPPVMHEFTSRSADRLADACTDPQLRAGARRRAKDLVPQEVRGQQLYDALFGTRQRRREAVYLRRRGTGGGGGAVVARIESDDSGGWS